MDDIKNIWDDFKNNPHSADEFKGFLAQHKDDLTLLSAMQSEIYNYYAKALIKESNGHETDGLIKAFEAIKSQLRLFLQNHDCDSSERIVFSFRNCSQYAIDDIKNKTCSLVHPSQFNDPFDPLMQNWLQAKIMQRNADFMQQEYYSLLLRAIAYLRMRCFVTAKADDIKNINPLMWAHYSQSYTGFCIKYKLMPSILKDYNNDLCSLTYDRVIYKIPKELNKIILKDALYAKKNIWKYENEIRFVAYDTELESTSAVKLIKNMSAEAIYIGCRCSEVNENLIIEATRGTTIPVYKMEINRVNPAQYVYKRII